MIYAALLLALPLEVLSAGGVFVVNSDDDLREDGCDARHCNLREAIEAANQAAPADIRFELPAFPYRIELRQPLPALRGGVTLDGASQAGADCPLPVVHIDGSAIQSEVPVVGLEVLGNRNRLRGLIITRFSGHGILVDGNENHLQCLFVGVDPTGTEAQGNEGHGIAVVGGHSNRVGGPGAMDGNLLSANGGRGLYLEDALNTYHAYNGVGIDVLGDPRLPNGDADLPPINPPPEPPNDRNERATAARIRAAERRVASIVEQHGRALEKAGLYKKYLRLIQTDRADPPADLSELLRLLAEQPELYGAFTAEASAILDEARYEAAVQLDRLGRAVRQSVPGFGRNPHRRGEYRFDVQADTLSVYSRSDYVLSGPPSKIVALEVDQGPPTQQPLWWHSLTTYGPTYLSQAYETWFEYPYPQPTPLQTCVSVAIGLTVNTACYWPVVYDLLPWSMQLMWQSPSLTQQQIEDIVQEKGYRLELWVNGKQLNIGPPPDSSLGSLVSLVNEYDILPGQGFYAASLPGRRLPGICPIGRTCLATTVLVQNALANVPQPWSFEIKVKRLEGLDFPVVVIDNLGKKVIATHTAKPIAQASQTILPNPETGGQAWFTAALYDTFEHPRCTTCHGFGTFDNIAIHHGAYNIEEWLNLMEAHLEPSEIVPAAHVIACDSCHDLPLENELGHPFLEVEWVVPHHDLNVNWSLQNAAQICARVKTNLPSQYLRYDHFHHDARLFWAIQGPVTPSLDLLEAAPPYDWQEFLRRVDLWNDFGAPCP